MDNFVQAPAHKTEKEPEKCKKKLNKKSQTQKLLCFYEFSIFFTNNKQKLFLNKIIKTGNNRKIHSELLNISSSLFSQNRRKEKIKILF